MHDEGNSQNFDDPIEPDPYYDIEEHEDHVHEYDGQDEIMPSDWFEHLKFPSIKSSSQLKAFTEDMILRPANHVFLYYYTSDCFKCYEQLDNLNRVHERAINSYGSDHVAIFKVNQTIASQVNDNMSDKFGIHTFPSFVYFETLPVIEKAKE